MPHMPSSNANTSKCSPRVRRALDADGMVLPGTCLFKEDIKELGRVVNEASIRHDERIPLDDPSYVLKRLHARFGTSPGEESEWLEDPSISALFDKDSDARARILEGSFRPKKPEEWGGDEHAWLSNFDIEAVMRQYEIADPTFAFIGVFPMDFDKVLPSTGTCVSLEMCNFDVVKAWKEGKRLVSAVFNTDNHDQAGSHWVCCNMCIDPCAPNYGFYYYDSVAREPTPEVLALSNRIKTAVERLHVSASSFPPTRRFTVLFNRIRRQYKDTECGVYAMFCVVCFMQRGLDPAYIFNAMGTDDMIHKMRDVFFR